MPAAMFISATEETPGWLPGVPTKLYCNREVCTEVLLGYWLSAVLVLFEDTLAEILRTPSLRFFMAVPLFLAAFSLLARLLRQGRKGRL